MFRHLFTPESIADMRAARKFIQTYAKDDNWHNIDFRTGNLGYGWLHYAYIRLLRPKRVLCVGSRYGYIPAVCALACKDNHLGVVDFVDAGYDENDQNQTNHWGGVGLWQRVNGKQYFGKFGLAPHIQLHVTTTQRFAQITQHTWGYVSLDGDHSYRGIKHDFKAFWPKLIPGGAMAFHDIYVKQMGNDMFGVYQLWQEIKRSHPHATTEIAGDYGLGILLKPTSHSLLTMP